MALEGRPLHPWMLVKLATLLLRFAGLPLAGHGADR